MDIEIAKYRPEHLASLVRLLDGSFHIRNPAKIELICWKFFDAIHRNRTVMALALDGGEVVSQYANTPVTLSDEGHPVPAMVCADMATAPTHRGRGLISQLARTVYADVTASGAVVSIGYSNDAGIQVDRNATGYGYSVVGRFARYVRPVLAPLPAPYRLEPVHEFDDALIPSLPGLRLRKSAEYLTWRYLRKPNADYRISLIVRAGQPAGYAVLRDARWRSHLVDLIAEPDAALLRAVQNDVLRQGRRVLVVYVLDNAYWRRLLRGFFRVPAHPRLENYYLTVKRHCEPAPHGWDSPDRWRLMGGDII